MSSERVDSELVESRIVRYETLMISMKLPQEEADH